MCFFKSPKKSPMPIRPEAPPPTNDLEPDIGSARRVQDEAMTGTSEAPNLRVDRSVQQAGDGTGLKM